MQGEDIEIGSQGPVPRLVVGLGNPGPEYEFTRHNLGFLVIDRLAERHGARVSRPDSRALTGPCNIGGAPVLLAKPQTFMNLSGPAVRSLADKHGFSAESLVLIYDDLALPWMSLRVRPEGSSGGHHGVESVIRSIGTSEFARVRIGIHPGHEVSDGADYVLSRFRREQMTVLDQVLDEGSSAVESIISAGVEKSMAKYNRRARGESPEEE